MTSVLGVVATQHKPQTVVTKFWRPESIGLTIQNMCIKINYVITQTKLRDPEIRKAPISIDLCKSLLIDSFILFYHSINIRLNVCSLK